MTSTLTPGKSGEWIEIIREATGPQFHCGYSESGCPCCTCEESSAVRVVYTRMRWSKSSKAHKPETRVEFLCMSHLTESIL